MAEGDPTFFDKLKANPVMLMGIILSIVGVIVALYGHQKGSKYTKYAGIGLTAGAAATAIGAYAYSEYLAGQVPPETTKAGTASPLGQVGAAPGYAITTPE